MGKSKSRKNKSSRPHKSLQQLASKRASKNIMKMLVEKSPEGGEHKFTLETTEGIASTFITVANKEVIVENPQLSEYLLNLFVQGTVPAGLTLETYTPNGGRVVRYWILDDGRIHGIIGDEAHHAAIQTGQLGGMPYDETDNVVFLDAPSLTDK